MQTEDLIAAAPLLDELFDAHREEIDRRGLAIHRDVEEGLLLARSPKLDRALRDLARFVLATVPDGCEVYVAATRTPARVAPVGAATVVARWQVAGRRPEHRGEASPVVQPLHPIAAEAETLAESDAANSLRAAFEAALWTLELARVASGAELMARARSR